jgi:hypothetical protein
MGKCNTILVGKKRTVKVKVVGISHKIMVYDIYEPDVENFLWWCKKLGFKTKLLKG